MAVFSPIEGGKTSAASVLLPLPLGPIIACTAPALMVRSIHS